MRSLKEHEGELIVALIPLIDKENYQEVRLLKVEDAGLWLESQALTNVSLAACGVTITPKTIVYFFPWHQIGVVLGSLPSPSVAEPAAAL